MTDYPMCVRRDVRLRLVSQEREFRDVVGAVVFGDLCVTRRPSSADFTIYHIPSGFALTSASALFRYEHTAVNAMVELGKLRNRWVFDDLSEMRALAPQIMEICQRHGGVLPSPGTLRGLPGDSQNLNGYGEKEETLERIRPPSAARRRR